MVTRTELSTGDTMRDAACDCAGDTCPATGVCEPQTIRISEARAKRGKILINIRSSQGQAGRIEDEFHQWPTSRYSSVSTRMEIVPCLQWRVKLRKLLPLPSVPDHQMNRCPDTP